MPEQVLLDLKRIDWETCDLQISAAISLRLIWLWDLRCDQYNARVYLTGDDTVYRRLRGALMTQLDRSQRYMPARDLALKLVPLPSRRVTQTLATIPNTSNSCNARSETCWMG